MASQEKKSLIAHVVAFMKMRIDSPPNMKQICMHFSISQSYLGHRFKKTCGISPMKFMLKLRIKKAQSLLRDSSLKVCEIAYILGFSDSAYFSRIFKKITSMTPIEYRRSSETQIKKYVEEEEYVRSQESENRYCADCLD